MREACNNHQKMQTPLFFLWTFLVKRKPDAFTKRQEPRIISRRLKESEFLTDTHTDATASSLTYRWERGISHDKKNTAMRNVSLTFKHPPTPLKYSKTKETGHGQFTLFFFFFLNLLPSMQRRAFSFKESSSKPPWLLSFKLFFFLLLVLSTRLFCFFFLPQSRVS